MQLPVSIRVGGWPRNQLHINQRYTKLVHRIGEHYKMRYKVRIHSLKRSECGVACTHIDCRHGEEWFPLSQDGGSCGNTISIKLICRDDRLRSILVQVQIVAIGVEDILLGTSPIWFTPEGSLIKWWVSSEYGSNLHRYELT